MSDEDEIIFFDVGWLDTVVVAGLTCFILCKFKRKQTLECVKVEEL